MIIFSISKSCAVGSFPLFLWAPILTLRSCGLFPDTQCDAVRTHCSAIKVPPQKLEPRGDLSIACHGQSPGRAFVPPTILVWGFTPHEPGGGGGTGGRDGFGGSGGFCVTGGLGPPHVPQLFSHLYLMKEFVSQRLPGLLIYSSQSGNLS